MSSESQAVMETVLLLFSILVQATVVSAFFDYGCSSRGCSPHGTFSMTAPLPTTSPSVRWNWTDSPTHPPGFTSRGCSSSFAVLTCPTDRGYVNLDNPTGRKLWEVTSGYTRPFLPLVDFFGNSLASDSSSFKLLWYDGSTQSDVDLVNFMPEFGPVMANYSVLVIASSNATSDQLLTYNTGGIVFASSRLNATLEGVAGTFVPCGHPVVDVLRTYLITCFHPERPTQPESKAVVGSRRLYAIDLTGYTQTPNQIAWYHDLPRHHDNGFLMPSPDFHSHSVQVFHNGTIYINTASPVRDDTLSSVQPPPPSHLSAIRDHGNSSSLVFHVMSTPGQLAVYDVTQAWDNTTATGVRSVWVVSDAPARLTAHHPHTGHVLVSLDLGSLAPGVGDLVTSDLMVTRHAAQPDRDLLLFGTQDRRGHAHVVALEAGLPPLKPRLLWSRDMSAGSDSQSTWRIGGQIPSVPLTDDGGWVFGVAVSAVESRHNSSTIHVTLLV